jgi:hypothetical protein
MVMLFVLLGKLGTCLNKVGWSCQGFDALLFLCLQNNKNFVKSEVLISHLPAFLSATKWSRRGRKGKGSKSQVDHDLIPRSIMISFLI